MSNYYTAIQLYEMADELPDGLLFKIKGGKTFYKYIGWMWRNSDKQIFLNTHSAMHEDEYKKRRYIDDNTLIEIFVNFKKD